MKRIVHSLVAVAVASAVSFSPAAGAVSQPFVETVYARGGHCGGGGHHGGYGYGYGNCNGGGVCYYYCNGHAAHLHNNGVCPYAQAVQPVQPARSAQAKKTVSKSTVKKVQRKLNRLGYRCGKVNGVMNVKTKKAVKRFKVSRGLRADSVIRKPVLKALGLSL